MTTSKKIILICTLIIALCLGSSIYLLKDTITLDSEDESDYHTVIYDGITYKFNSSIIPILFLGIDTTNDSTNQGQSDVLALLLIDRDNKDYKVLMIPRDTMTDIKTYDAFHNYLGWDKEQITLAYGYGMDQDNGCMLSCEAVSKLLNDIPINYYISMNLSSLSALNDIVGDLSFTVPNDSVKDVNPEWYQGNSITINSSNVESYLRTRDINIDESPLDRQERQVSYINAYVDKLSNLLEENHDQTITKLKEFYCEVVSNLPLDDLLDYVDMFDDYTYDDHIYTLEGNYQVTNLYAEYVIDQDYLNQKVIELFYKKKG